MIALNKIKTLLKGLKPKPNEKIARSSLSLFSFRKHKRRPNIIIKGVITVIMLVLNIMIKRICLIFQYLQN